MKDKYWVLYFEFLDKMRNSTSAIYVPFSRAARLFKRRVLRVSPERISLRRFLIYGVKDPPYTFFHARHPYGRCYYAL
jgi:hypothetical protein